MIGQYNHRSECIEMNRDEKKIMILGAGIYQVPLILKAKEMGLKTLVVSIAGEYPGIPLADKFIELDTRDYDGILHVARQENIGGICTSGTDVAVRAIGCVCDAMGLSGISEESAKLCTDKALMKAAFQKGGVSSASFFQVRTKQEALQAADQIGYPVMVKAVDSSGSRGIEKVNKPQDMAAAWEDAMKVTAQDYILVEEFIEAEEIGVDGFLDENGSLAAFFPHRKDTYTFAQTTMPVGHRFPMEAEESQLIEIEKQITLAAHALQMRRCPFNADVFVRGNQVWVIEMGGRTGATCIPELISMNQGYDWYEKIIAAAMGQNVSFQGRKNESCMARLIFSPVDGRIKEIDTNCLKILQDEGVLCQLDVKPGDTVSAMRNGTDRIGHLIMSGTSEERLECNMKRLQAAVQLDKGNLAELW